MIISDKLLIALPELGGKFTKLCEKFTYTNPEFMVALQTKRSTKNIPKHLYHYAFQNIGQVQYLVLPRGAIGKVRDFCTAEQIPLRIMDKRIDLDPIDVHLQNTTVEPQQQDIVRVLTENIGGLIEASPGAGKTVSVISMIAQIKQPTLIIVHEHRLREQWESEIKYRLGGNYKLGRLDGDKKVEGNVVIGLIDTLYNLVKEDPTCLDKYGMVVVDESHHVSCTTFLAVLNSCKAKWRIGVTGTVERKDGMHILALDVFGPVLIKIAAENVKHRITNFDFEMINTDIAMELPTVYRWDGKRKSKRVDITNTITLLTQNEERNDLICRKIADNIDAGEYPLVVSDRVDHCKELYRKVTEMGYKAVMLIGENRKKAKWSDIRADESIQCLIAQTTIAKEALDCPRLSRLHLTCTSSNMPKIKQEVGRIRRAMDGKSLPIVYDYVDNLAYFEESTLDKFTGEMKKKHQYVLKGTAYKRQKFYRQLQFEYISGTDTE